MEVISYLIKFLSKSNFIFSNSCASIIQKQVVPKFIIQDNSLLRHQNSHISALFKWVSKLMIHCLLRSESSMFSGPLPLKRSSRFLLLGLLLRKLGFSHTSMGLLPNLSLHNLHYYPRLKHFRCTAIATMYASSISQTFQVQLLSKL